MIRATLFALVTAALAPVLARQVPLDSDHPWLVENQLPLGEPDLTEWSFDKIPGPNDTHQLVFETVYSLLQHWPNTRMRNGHNIVPGIVPKGTLLYHGRLDNEIPSRPDWVATDPEHSYLFCRDRPRINDLQQGCYQLTLSAMRSLKVIYFDGSSAAKIPYGSLDTQDLLAWGKVGANEVFDERERIDVLCKWGKDFGLDGFVRMEMDFEVMLCNFQTTVSVVSSLNLINRRNVSPSALSFVSFEATNSGSWHNRFPGETRVQLDLAGLVSFYDTELVPSLVAVRAGQERWDHRVRDVSSEDLSALKSRLEEILTRPKGRTSGFEWRTFFQVIVDRFAGRLELTRYLLNSTATDPNEFLDLVNKAQTQLRIMLTPYIVVSAEPTNPSNAADLDWTRPIFKLCGVTHTYFLESHVISMSDSEKLLFQALQGTTREICRVVTKMWAAGVYAGIDPSLNTKETVDVSEAKRVWDIWGRDLNRLMTWLDWSVWVKCEPECGPEEICYLPTWPFGFPRPRRGHGPSSPPGRDRWPRPEKLSSFELRTMVTEHPADEMSNTIQPDADDWVRPQPRCIRQVAPYTP